MARRHGAGLDEIERVYRDRVDELRSTAAAIVRDRQEGCDVVQDAFALAVRKRATFRGEGPLEAWLWRLVVNTALSRARRRAAGRAGAAVAAAPTNGHFEGCSDVELAISLLPERQRLALFLRYYADLDYRTIADVLGVAVGTVSATLSAAHRAVRRTLEEVGR